MICYSILTIISSTTVDAFAPRRSRVALSHHSSQVVTRLASFSPVSVNAGSRAAIAFGFLLWGLDAITPTASAALEQSFYYNWQFGSNGNVILPAVTQIGDQLRLKNPVLLGSGGGGAVFAMESVSGDSSAPVALKVSWKGSANAVARECRILQALAARQATTTDDPSFSSLEVCLGMAPYPFDNAGRTMIALQPVFADEQVANIEDLLPDRQRLETAVTSVIQTMMQLLSAGIVTADVQPLISRATGRILFIDFTEASQLECASSNSRKNDLCDADQAAVSNFVSEMMALIPSDQQETTASTFLHRELRHYYPLISPRISKILLEQNFSKQVLDLLQDQLSATSANKTNCRPHVLTNDL